MTGFPFVIIPIPRSNINHKHWHRDTIECHFSASFSIVASPLFTHVAIGWSNVQKAIWFLPFTIYLRAIDVVDGLWRFSVVIDFSIHRNGCQTNEFRYSTMGSSVHLPSIITVSKGPTTLDRNWGFARILRWMGHLSDYLPACDCTNMKNIPSRFTRRRYQNGKPQFAQITVIKCSSNICHFSLVSAVRSMMICPTAYQIHFIFLFFSSSNALAHASQRCTCLMDHRSRFGFGTQAIAFWRCIDDESAFGWHGKCTDITCHNLNHGH